METPQRYLNAPTQTGIAGPSEAPEKVFRFGTRTGIGSLVVFSKGVCPEQRWGRGGGLEGRTRHAAGLGFGRGQAGGVRVVRERKLPHRRSPSLTPSFAGIGGFLNLPSFDVPLEVRRLSLKESIPRNSMLARAMFCNVTHLARSMLLLRKGNA